MDNDVSKMLAELKAKGFPISKVESDLGFSNGLLGKAAKEVCSLSPDKYAKLWNYHLGQMGELKLQPLKVASEIPPKPVIDNECRQIKDYCKENGLSVSDIINFHQSNIQSKQVPKVKVKDLTKPTNQLQPKGIQPNSNFDIDTTKSEKSERTMTYFEKRQKGLLK